MVNSIFYFVILLRRICIRHSCDPFSEAVQLRKAGNLRNLALPNSSASKERGKSFLERICRTQRYFPLWFDDWRTTFPFWTIITDSAHHILSGAQYSRTASITAAWYFSKVVPKARKMISSTRDLRDDRIFPDISSSSRYTISISFLLSILDAMLPKSRYASVMTCKQLSRVDWIWSSGRPCCIDSGRNVWSNLCRNWSITRESTTLNHSNDWVHSEGWICDNFLWFDSLYIKKRPAKKDKLSWDPYNFSHYFWTVPPKFSFWSNFISDHFPPSKRHFRAHKKMKLEVV